MAELTEDQKWQVISLLSAVGAAVLVRGGIQVVWKATRDDDPPLNPLRQDGSWADAVVFSAAVGVAAGLARLAARAIAITLERENTKLLHR